MTTNKTLWQLVRLCLCAWVACTPIACSEMEDETPPPPGSEVEASSDISFSIVDADGKEIGGSAAPAVVAKGDTLQLSISQKSSYTDTDGTVTTVEPKATIAVFARLDTICVKDLKTLVNLGKATDIQTSQSGTSPRLCRTVQKFDVGGQEITFDLGYEIYSLTTQAGNNVEMPYVKLNPAQYGEASTAATRAAATAAVSAITLKPVADRTRGIVVTDSTMYEVTVKFHLQAESANTPTGEAKTVSFEVNYVGVVEDSRELPDPELSFSYNFQVLGGTRDTSSPFTLTTGETLSLEWHQSAVYSFFSLAAGGMQVISTDPKATLKLSALADTVRVGSVEELTRQTASDPVVTTSGENPTQTCGKRTFDIGGQQITAEWTHEAYKGLLPEGGEIALPHLMLGEVKLVDVSVTELPDEEIPNGWMKLYEVTARFSQELSSADAPEPTQQTLEYVVKYIGAVEITLVDISYRKDYVWEEAHDNIEPCTRYILYRDRKYSNGETLTDTFISGLCGVEWYLFAYKIGGEDYRVGSTFEHWCDDGEKVFLAFTVDYHNRCHREIGYYGVKDIYKTGAEDISLITTKLYRDDMPEGKPGEHRADYWLMGTNEHYNPENPTPGWYFHGLSRIVSYYPLYPDSYCGSWPIRKYSSMLCFYDRFLYIDGQIFDFHEFAPTYEYDFHEESSTTQEGYPARVFNYNSKLKYCGREYNVTLIDTIYQRPQGK